MKSLRQARYGVLICLGLQPLGAARSLCAEMPPVPQQIAPALAQRGVQLRAAVIRRYKQLRAAGLIRQKNEPDVTAIVSKYIPPGSSFEEAEAILRAAGWLRWRRTPLTGPPIPGSDGALHARFGLPGAFFGIASFGVGYWCGVTLSPRTPGDFSIVGQVQASIGVSYL